MDMSHSICLKEKLKGIDNAKRGAEQSAYEYEPAASCAACGSVPWHRF